MSRSRQAKVNTKYLDAVTKMSQALGVPRSQGFVYREKLLLGEFKAKKKKKQGSKKTFFELVFE